MTLQWKVNIELTLFNVLAKNFNLSYYSLFIFHVQFDVNTHEFRSNLVRHNRIIIHQSNNWNVLLFKEASVLQRNVL